MFRGLSVVAVSDVGTEFSVLRCAIKHPGSSPPKHIGLRIRKVFTKEQRISSDVKRNETVIVS